jgi:hypothetical protein
MLFKRRGLLQIKEGLQRQEGWGTLKERTKTWFIESSTGICGRSADRRLDGQPEETDWESLEAGY